MLHKYYESTIYGSRGGKVLQNSGNLSTVTMRQPEDVLHHIPVGMNGKPGGIKLSKAAVSSQQLELCVPCRLHSSSDLQLSHTTTDSTQSYMLYLCQ